MDSFFVISANASVVEYVQMRKENWVKDRKKEEKYKKGKLYQITFMRAV